MSAPGASAPQLPVDALGYVDITGFRPPASGAVPGEHDPLVQAALAHTTERRQPCAPLRVCAVEGRFVLADLDSYREWWALRKTGSGIGRVEARWVEVVETGAITAPAAALPARNQKKPVPPASPAAGRPLAASGNGVQVGHAESERKIPEYSAGPRAPTVHTKPEQPSECAATHEHHSAAAIFPMMEGPELRGLSADIG